MILRNLRPAGSKEYVIPKGFAFDYITCANYTFEIYGWILFGIATQTVAAFIFVAAGSFPMSQWAIGKHKRLQKVTVHISLLFGATFPRMCCCQSNVSLNQGALQGRVVLQMFDGTNGKPKYPKRWVVFPPIL